ncbi:hypothetical protein [Shewanella colwelliana]|uniref:hypothetical protein n=1 Tax=Shewanella colwelliana TaxID=23 RepID=UPI0037351E7E
MRKPMPNNMQSEHFINSAEDGGVLKRGRPKSGVKTKPVTISCTKNDLEAMEEVIEFALNIKDADGKRVKLNQSEAVRLGFEAVKVIANDSPEMFEALLGIVKSGR